MSKVRCFLNGDPKNFYYVSDKVMEFAYDENGNDLGDPLTESGLAEDGCVYIPTKIRKGIYGPSAYELIADGSLTKESIKSVYVGDIDSQYLLNRDWDKYKSIVDSGAYTKENGFDIQKLKEMGYGYYTSSKPINEVNPSDDNCNENVKSENNDGLNLNAIIEESVKTFNAKYAELGGDPETLDPVIFEKALNFVIDGNFDVTTKNLAKEAIDYIKSRRK